MTRKAVLPLRVVLAVVLLSALVVLAAPGPAAALPASPWTGSWDNGTEVFTLSQGGSAITGASRAGCTGNPTGVKLEGEVTSADGTKAHFTYTGGTECPGEGGEFDVVMSSDGKTVTGNGVTQYGTPFQTRWTYVGGGTEPREATGFRCPEGKRAARVTKVTGDAGAERGGTLVDLLEGDEICVDANVITSFDSELFLEFGDGSKVTIYRSSSIRINEFLDQSNRIRVEMLLRAGQMRGDVKPQPVVSTDWSVTTPEATTGVKGTVFTVGRDAIAKRTTVVTQSGSVEVDPKGRGATKTVGAKKAIDVTPKGVMAVSLKTATARAKARDRVLARIAKARACKLTVKTVTVAASKKAWKVTVKTSKGKSTWKVTGAKTKPANALAKKIAAGCA